MDMIEKVQFLVKRLNPVFLQVGTRDKTKKRSCCCHLVVSWGTSSFEMQMKWAWTGAGLCLNSQGLHGDFRVSPRGGGRRRRGHLNFHCQLGSPLPLLNYFSSFFTSWLCMHLHPGVDTQRERGTLPSIVLPLKATLMQTLSHTKWDFY